MNYNIHSVDPEFDKLTADMALAFIEKIDTLLISLGSFLSRWWYKKQNTPMVEMIPRMELRILDDHVDLTSDVDLDDLVYVKISLES
jgi:hypothetical protein